MSPGKRKILFVVVGVFFGITVGLLLSEILLRIVAPQWLVKQMKALNIARNAASFGSDVGWSVESIDGKFVRFVPDTQFPVRYYEYNNTAHIDHLGGRVVTGDSHQSDKTPVIPFLGDSFAFGIGVEDDQTYVSLLNSRSRYRFINLGIPGSALPNHLDQIEFRHSQLHSPPVYVFSFYTGNDYVDIVKYYNRTNLRRPGRNNSGPFIDWLDHSVYHNRVLGKSYLLQFIKHTLLRNQFYPPPNEKIPVLRFCTMVVRGKPPVTNGAMMIMAGKQKCIKEIEPYVKLAVDRLKQLSVERKFTPIFLIIPDKIQVMRTLREPKAASIGMNLEDLDPQLPSQVIEDQLRSHGIQYFDLAGCLQGTGLYYKIDDHFTPAGHRAVAKCISSKLDAAISSVIAKNH